MAVVTSWLWYRRHSRLLDQTSTCMQLSEFQVHIANGLIGVRRLPGRPSGYSNSPCTFRPSTPSEHQPILDIRFDSVGHMPEWGVRGRCKAKCPGFTYVRCQKCKVHLCFNKDRNCFKDHHSK
ncbi:PiggyBac transposable element-derived protein 2 [Plakobranchus ocellatus]|uniref:PiggyBac transposable element-derived protein 2 n=1 Tax=Plakobranchus ocellatus TaxID=259542 RepID=A0AAV3YNY8_9GAST|nr:PiggyBac transposable element-derived protein 2 [Plakobranchus ocellatus]